MGVCELQDVARVIKMPTSTTSRKRKSNESVVSVNKEGQRKMKKNKMEQLKRKRINMKMEELADLLQLSGARRIEKSVVLDKAYSVIRKLKEQNANLRADHAKITNDFAGLSIDISGPGARTASGSTFSMPRGLRNLSYLGDLKGVQNLKTELENMKNMNRANLAPSIPQLQIPATPKSIQLRRKSAPAMGFIGQSEFLKPPSPFLDEHQDTLSTPGAILEETPDRTTENYKVAVFDVKHQRQFNFSDFKSLQTETTLDPMVLDPVFKIEHQTSSIGMAACDDLLKDLAEDLFVKTE